MPLIPSLLPRGAVLDGADPFVPPDEPFPALDVVAASDAVECQGGTPSSPKPIAASLPSKPSRNRREWRQMAFFLHHQR